MEKTKKLRRYSRKDYSQLVDFPVEIVGRDGVIRRYSFESSVRLYQRRIASAPSRYEDVEVVDAEVKHCRLRIEQLRKSYFHRYGWSSIRADDAPGGLAGDLAGEVAAFLRRFYGDDAEPERLEVTWVQDDGDCQVYFVTLSGSEDRHLLYLFRFTEQGPCEGRDAFFSFLGMLRAVRGEGVESLVAFHHTADCGLVLTGSGGSANAAPVAAQEQDEDAEEGPIDAAWFASVHRATASDPLYDGMRLLASGNAEGALGLLEQGLAQGPFQRKLAVAVAVVADAVGRAELSEMAARLGCYHLPDDAVFHYHLGLARVRQGDLAQGRAALTRARELSPGLPAVSLLLGLLVLRGGGLIEARGLLSEALQKASADDLDLQQLAGRQRAQVHACLSVGALSALCSVLALALLLMGASSGPWVTALALSGVAVTLWLRVWALRGVHPERLASARLAPPEPAGGRGPVLDDLVV